MAGVKGRSGGDRPRDPFAISAVGGAGSKDGQPKRYISGGKYGEGKALMEQQQGASMSAPKMGAVSRGEYSEPMSKLRTLLDDTTNPSEPQSTGINFGRGADSSIMPQNLVSDSRPLENQEIVKKYLPAFANAAKSPNAPDSFKGFVNYLVGKINA
jgi:hypothetical protein